MLAAARRLRHRGEFAAAVRGGRRSGRGCLVVHLIAPAPEDPAAVGVLPARAGFVVPRTVGGAVVRNRVRRRLRHLMLDRLPGLPAGSMVVIRAVPGAADVSYPQLAADLDAALAAARAPRRPRTPEARASRAGASKGLR